ncbi:hypothetical protein HK096_008703, partial [Nowakowskiella sp. JEL0078]
QAGKFVRCLKLVKALSDNSFSNLVKDLSQTENTPEGWLKEVSFTLKGIEILPQNFWSGICDFDVTTVIYLRKSLATMLIHPSNKDFLLQIAKIFQIEKKSSINIQTTDEHIDDEFIMDIKGLLPTDQLLASIFSQFKNLKCLAFHDYACTASPETILSYAFRKLPRLTHLGIFGSGRMHFNSVANAWEVCTKLIELSIHNIDFPPDFMIQIAMHPNIRQLRIFNCFISVPTLVSLLQCSKTLEVFALEKTLITTKEITSVIMSCPQTLRAFAYSPKNEIIVNEKNIDEFCLSTISTKFPSLRALRIFACKVTDSGISEITKCKHLRSLDFSMCHGYTDASIRLVVNLPMLRILHLYAPDNFNELVDFSVLKYIAKARRLVSLMISIGNGNEDDIVKSVVNLCKNLRLLKNLVPPKQIKPPPGLNLSNTSQWTFWLSMNRQKITVNQDEKYVSGMQHFDTLYFADNFSNL